MELLECEFFFWRSSKNELTGKKIREKKLRQLCCLGHSMSKRMVANQPEQELGRRKWRIGKTRGHEVSIQNPVFAKAGIHTKICKLYFNTEILTEPHVSCLF